ncbi:hypothetical protein [Lapillicoccus jejuensis]|uniref:Uncharacterized protein n=1 Tax=Lapillicoccus jejuensis TaxID=402171 RepID=A0A542E1C1_9MICO|nr:hypothetical protein [Lapillicoccus jejuensis]TQJ09115.1 hypothetical protein FB458_2221 [Lapillicoccus jejuensis]
MRYSLVNATALGFDLVRMPGGAQVAEVLLAACAATPSELALLGRHHPGAGRTARWEAARRRSLDLRPTLSTTDVSADAVAHAASDADAASSLVTRLAEAPLGSLDALDHFVRHDALEGIAPGTDHDLAADVLVDAATAGYCSTLLDGVERRRLAAPFVQGRREGLVPTPAPTVPAVRRLLEDLRGWGPVEWAEMDGVLDAVRASTSGWSEAMHEAGWAAHLSGRVRTAAVSQLQAVSAYAASGLTPTQAAFGAWNALSGVVQALVVADLLGEPELDLLVRPWLLVRGHDPRPPAGQEPPRR